MPHLVAEDVVRAKMLEHDEHVGALLARLDKLGVADNTIVVYSTDNGNELSWWNEKCYPNVPYLFNLRMDSSPCCCS